MRWQLTVIVDRDDGAYEVQFRNLDEPGGRIDYDLIMVALHRVLADLDTRVDAAVNDATTEHAGEKIEVHLISDEALGDDVIN